MRNSIYRLTVTTLGVVLTALVVLGCENLFADGSDDADDDDTRINGAIKLSLEQAGDPDIEVSLDGSLTAVNFDIDSFEVQGDATFDGDLDGEPSTLSGEVTIDGGVPYDIEDILGVGALLETAVFSPLDDLGEPEPDGFTVDGDLGEMWDNGEITVTFTDEHPVVAEDGTLVLSGSSNGQVQLAIVSENLVVEAEPTDIDLEVDVVVVFDEIPTDDTEPVDAFGTVTVDEVSFDLGQTMVVGSIFEMIGITLADLEAYFDDTEPNPYTDPETYPAGISVTVDTEEEDGDPIPLPAVVTIHFTNFSPE